LSDDPQVIALTADCLRLAGFIQVAFAAAMIFSAALRGAGDTLNVMLLNLASILGVRLVGVLLVTQWLGMALVGIWSVLCLELVVRGGLLVARYHVGRWHEKQV
jgi:Na+-driven multidrug efflux pump